MEEYVGLDVSKEETAFCVKDEVGGHCQLNESQT